MQRYCGKKNKPQGISQKKKECLEWDGINFYHQALCLPHISSNLWPLSLGINHQLVRSVLRLYPVNWIVSVRWIHVNIEAVFSQAWQQTRNCVSLGRAKETFLCVYPGVMAIPVTPHLIPVAVQAGHTHHTAFKHNWNNLRLLVVVPTVLGDRWI